MELDDAYANMAHISQGQDYPDHWLSQATTWAASHAALGLHQANIPYGTRPREQFDLFTPPGTSCGLMVFVHGGYWIKFDRSYWFHLAQGDVARGWAVAMPSYDVCPHVRIADITHQIPQAIATAAQRVDGPIVLAGHSAGGHLVSRMMQPGLLASDLAARIKNTVAISPVSDLRPLLKTSMNAQFQLTTATAIAESTIFMTDRLNIPCALWVGGDERPAFLDQARWQAEAWNVPLHTAHGKHHFDVIEALKDPNSDMLNTILP